MMLPDSIPSSVWEEFKKMRKKIRAPLTEYAETLIICKLEKWKTETGANPVDILNESIEKGWRGVFLNGHGASKTPSDLRVEMPSNSRTALLCALCQAPLISGWILSRHGKICGRCA